MILRASYGTLGFLGLGKKIKGQKTAYFMLDGSCVFDCSYCTHARSASSESRFLSRVVWKEVSLQEAGRVLEDPDVERVCLQVVSYPGYESDTLKAIEFFSRKPVSVSVRARSVEEIRAYFNAGADRLGLAVDVVDEDLYRKHRGGSLEGFLKLLEKAALEYPGKITTHIIIGLGESEKSVVDMFRWLHDRGIEVALFAFTPLRGTKLQRHPRPDLESYRKIQIVRYLIFEKGYDPDLRFDEDGRIIHLDIGVYGDDLKKAFLTSGCPGCTRPFYNERPSGDLYNIHDEDLLERINLSNFFP